MQYTKLLGIKIDDFCSSIEFEKNYGSKDNEEVNDTKKNLETKGYVCLLAKITNNIQI